MGQIATTLGIEASDVAGMSVRELQDAIDGVQSTAFDTGRELQNLSTDPALGPAERAMYGQMLEDFGSVSGEKAEVEFADLMKSVEDMDTIEFAGQEYGMDEILDSEEMSAIVKDFFANPEMAKELREKEPEFAAILDKHSTVLEQMTKGIETTYEKVDTLIEEQKEALMDSAGMAIPTEVITSILGREVDPTNVSANFVQDLQESELYQAYKDPAKFAKDNGLTQQEATTLKNVLPDIAELDPNFMGQIAQMTATEIAALVRVDESGAAPIENAQRFQAEQSVLLKKDAAGDPEGFFNALAGPGEGVASGRLQDLVSTALASSKIGVALDPETQRLVDLIDKDKDGKLDDAAAIQQRLKEGTGGMSFQDLLKTGSKSLVMDTASAVSRIHEGNTKNPLILDALKDGIVDRADINRIAGQLSLSEMEDLADNLGHTLNDKASGRLQDYIHGARVKEVKEHTNLDINELEREMKIADDFFAEQATKTEGRSYVPPNSEKWQYLNEHLARIIESPVYAKFPKSVQRVVEKHRERLDLYMKSPSRAFIKSSGKYKDVAMLPGEGGE